MFARHIELRLNSIPRHQGLILSLTTGLFNAPIAAHGNAYMPIVFGSDPNRQSHERWLYP